MLGNVEGVLGERIVILAGRGGAYGCEKGNVREEEEEEEEEKEE